MSCLNLSVSNVSPTLIIVDLFGHIWLKNLNTVCRKGRQFVGEGNSGRGLFLHQWILIFFPQPIWSALLWLSKSNNQWSLDGYLYMLMWATLVTKLHSKSGSTFGSLCGSLALWLRLSAQGRRLRPRNSQREEDRLHEGGKKVLITNNNVASLFLAMWVMERLIIESILRKC